MLLNAARYRSRFGGFWTDMDNAREEVRAKLESGAIDPEEAELLNVWIAKGYVILPNAVPHEVIDRIAEHLERVWENGDDRVKVEIENNRVVPLKPGLPRRPGYRILDFYALCPAALEAIFADKIQRFLELVFETDSLAFQGLLFDRGSEQPIHQDTAFVVVSSPMELVASWIALEDIQEGSGELIYYEGSHQLEEFYFNEIYKNWDGSKDSWDVLEQYLESLHAKSKAMNLPLKKFRARKGDVLIWSADLAHGGSKITHSNPQVTRRSLVAHYCPNRVRPSYLRTVTPVERVKMPFKNNSYYSSAHYILSEMKPPIEPLLESRSSEPKTSTKSLLNSIKPFVPTAISKLMHKLRLRGKW